MKTNIVLPKVKCKYKTLLTLKKEIHLIKLSETLSVLHVDDWHFFYEYYDIKLLEKS